MAGTTFATRPWRRALLWLTGLGPFFYLSYGVANWLAGQREDVPSIVFAWEHGLPFLAWTILPYWSVNLFYAASVFVCRDRDELDGHGRRLLAAQVLAVTCFLVAPLAYTFQRPDTDGWAGFMFAALTSFDKPFNQAPSLHIALMIILWSLYTRYLQGAWRWAFHLWFTLIGVSVLTTYQHHFIDIPAGLWLGWLCVALFPLQADHTGWWPLPWRSTTDPRCRQLAIRYAAGALALLVPGVFVLTAALAPARGVWDSALLGTLGVGLLWSGAALGLVALIYRSGDGRRFQKSPSGRHSTAVAWLLAPYRWAVWLNRLWWTRGDKPRVEIQPGVWLARCPGARDLSKQSTLTVVDLVPELPLQGPAHRLPVLDLVVPSADQLRQAADAIESGRAHGPVWVCCALGYSRSASAVATWLLRHGGAGDRSQALHLLRQARPRVALSDAHWLAIEAAAA